MLFINLPTDRPLGSFHVFSVVINIAMNTGVLTSLQDNDFISFRHA